MDTQFQFELDSGFGKRCYRSMDKLSPSLSLDNKHRKTECKAENYVAYCWAVRRRRRQPRTPERSPFSGQMVPCPRASMSGNQVHRVFLLKRARICAGVLHHKHWQADPRCLAHDRL